MSYERLSKCEKELIDALMHLFENTSKERNTAKALGSKLKKSESTIKHSLEKIGLKYGIDTHRYHLSCRLVYLRAKELRLL